MNATSECIVKHFKNCFAKLRTIEDLVQAKQPNFYTVKRRAFAMQRRFYFFLISDLKNSYSCLKFVIFEFFNLNYFFSILIPAMFYICKTETYHADVATSQYNLYRQIYKIITIHKLSIHIS